MSGGTANNQILTYMTCKKRLNYASPLVEVECSLHAAMMLCASPVDEGAIEGLEIEDLVMSEDY